MTSTRGWVETYAPSREISKAAGVHFAPGLFSQVNLVVNHPSLLFSYRSYWTAFIVETRNSYFREMQTLIWLPVNITYRWKHGCLSQASQRNIERNEKLMTVPDILYYVTIIWPCMYEKTFFLEAFYCNMCTIISLLPHSPTVYPSSFFCPHLHVIF